MTSQRGFTLVEALAVIGLTTFCVGALVMAIGAFAKFGGHADGPTRSAALLLAEQTLRTAQDAWKYGAPGNAPSGTFQTSLPIAVPSSSPTTVPATLTATVSAVGDAADVAVTVQYTPDPGRDDPGTVTVTGKLRVKAPLPGSQVVRPGLVPMPSGAP